MKNLSYIAKHTNTAILAQDTYFFNDERNIACHVKLNWMPADKEFVVVNTLKYLINAIRIFNIANVTFTGTGVTIAETGDNVSNVVNIRSADKRFVSYAINPEEIFKHIHSDNVNIVAEFTLSEQTIDTLQKGLALLNVENVRLELADNHCVFSSNNELHDTWKTVVDNVQCDENVVVLFSANALLTADKQNTNCKIIKGTKGGYRVLLTTVDADNLIETVVSTTVE